MKAVLSHFASTTISTLSPGESSRLAWCEILPDLATQERYVLHGILAVGCLHLSILAPAAPAKDDYQDLAATQMNIGMAQYRLEIKEVKLSNAEPLFAFSTMITTFVLSTAGTECKTTLEPLRKARLSSDQYEEHLSTLVQSISRIFRAIRGVLVILVPCYHHLRAGKLKPVLERDWWPLPVPVTAEELEVDQKLRHLEVMWSQPGKSYEYSFDTFRSAHKILREDFALISRLANCPIPGDIPNQKTFDWTAALNWPVQLNLEFLSLIEQRRMECWVLLAHYAILPSKATTNPWLGGFATNIVTTSALVIGEENWHWIAWPASVLGLIWRVFELRMSPHRLLKPTMFFISS
ncbi:hypothetical protein GQ44DRAFT_604846 [Phaeosphaeriaceae sp. PMI808]|nr:hypothetical protein GQ44DRAFT_604846 [Phaeosphaeriaceae sp. PMI808]